MKIRILSVGKTTQPFILEGEAEYLKRMKSFARVEIVEIAPKLSAVLAAEEVRRREAQKILEKIGEREFVIALDEHGKSLTSEDFAKNLSRLADQGHTQLVFVLGGAGGLDPAVRARAALTVSLSPLTFTYQFARLLLIEQIYRACTIIKGVPYHK
jgi:23S rRNA (pseudouridine1915-N3)-methyltransferase